MQIDFPLPDAEACDALAGHHLSSLPTSAMSALGGNFLRSFYRFAARSEHEQVIVCRQDAVPVAGALVSHQPGSLNRRIMFKTPLIWAVLSHLHLKAVRQAVSGGSVLSWNDPSQDYGDPPAPELLALYCQSGLRSQGIGGALLDQVEHLLLAAGVSRYFVRTFEEKGNPALRFYIRHGFSAVGRLEAHGMQFSLLVKYLSPENKAELSE